jgi:hypothetical protein
MDDLELNGQKQLYLEAVALCGAERPAVANLPPAEFSKQSKQVFTINTNGGQDMPENETVTATEPIDLVKYKEDLEAQFAKKIAEKESEWAKREETEIAARMEAELKLRKEKVTQWVNSKAILTKVRADQRENCIALAMKLHGTSEKVTFGKKEMGLSDAFTAFVESLPDFISPKEVAAYLPKDIINADVLPEDPGEQDKFLLNKINAYAAEKGIELKTPEDFTKVEGIVKKQFQGVK